MKYCSVYICWIIIVVIINSLNSGVNNLLLSCCGMNLSIDYNLGHYPSYNLFPTKWLALA